MEQKTGELLNTESNIDEDIKEPSQYKVLLLNDDYTTKEFVTAILMTIFHKEEEESLVLMQKVHTSGSAVVGVYSYDIARTRIAMTIQTARKNGYPLQCKLEEC